MTKQTQLAFREVAPEGGAADGVLFAMHGLEADARQLLPVTRRLNRNMHVYALDGPRPSIVYARQAEGRAWYAMQGLTRPETTSFGDTLSQVERFVLNALEKATDEGREELPPVFLLALDQATPLALILGRFWPELFAGIVAVRGYVPHVAGWSPPETSLDGMPILLINDPQDAELTPETKEETAKQLTEWGAQLTVTEVAGAGAVPASLADTMNDWLATLRSD